MTGGADGIRLSVKITGLILKMNCLTDELQMEASVEHILAIYRSSLRLPYSPEHRIAGTAGNKISCRKCPCKIQLKNNMNHHSEDFRE